MKAILTINFNCPHFLDKQIRLCSRFIKTDFDFFVGDNSRDIHQKLTNQNIATLHNAHYIDLNIKEGDPSRSHGLALNHCLNNELSIYDQVLILDHDIFPFRSTDPFYDYEGFDYAGIHQIKDGGVNYIAPIWMLINNRKEKVINMMPIAHLDTGGAMAESMKQSKVHYVNEQLQDNENYAIVDDCWMHFVKGSNWNNNPNHEARLNDLFNTLENIIKK